MDENLKVQDIIQKLKQLDCPLLSNGDDAWIKEILFKQNFDRYHLMEWVFSKLGFRIPKGDECQNSSEVKLKNLLGAISALGLCNKDNSSLIEGLASFKEQLNFWTLLVDILWKKICATHPSNRLGSIEDQYERQIKYVNSLCNSINSNFKYMFKEKVKLFPSFLLKESAEADSKHLSSIQTLKEITLKASESTNLNWSVKNHVLDENVISSNSNNSIIASEEKVIQLEEDLRCGISNLHNHASEEFSVTYDKLKLYLNVPQEKTIDLGPPFRTTHLKSKTFLKLKDSLSTLKSSEIELKNMNKDFDNHPIPCEFLSDVLLGEYITILNEEKERNKKD